MISNQQKKDIHIAAHGAGLISNHDDTAYRAMLQDLYDVNSCLKLSFNQARELINKLRVKKGSSVTQVKLKKTEIPEPDEPVTRKQLYVINKYYDFLGYSVKSRMTFNNNIIIGWYRNQKKIDDEKPIKKRKNIVVPKHRHWPQNHVEGAVMTHTLIRMTAPKYLEVINKLSYDRLTPWERGFIFHNEFAAKKELELYVAKKRGGLSDPYFSPTFFFEIIEKRSSLGELTA